MWYLMLKTISNSLLFAAVLSFTAIVGCSDKDGGNKGGGSDSDVAICGMNQVRTDDNRCLHACPDDQNKGYDPDTGKCVSGTSSTNFWNSQYRQWEGRLNIVNSNKYEKFLKEYGLICDQYSLLNLGSSDCDNWNSRGYVYFQSDSGTLPANGAITVVAESQTSWYSPYPQQRQISIPGRVEPIDDDSGFEIRSTGYANTYSYGSVIRAVANPADLENDDVFVINLYYDGTLFATAQVRR